MNTLNAAQQFFFDNAGYSWNPATESPEQGRLSCACALARAEAEARSRGYRFAWSIDSDITSADWINDNEDGGKNCEPWPTWSCACMEHVPGSGSSRTLETVGGVDFGRDGSPATSDYSRVVEAELALSVILNDE